MKQDEQNRILAQNGNEGWYDLTDIRNIIFAGRVFGQPGVIHPETGDARNLRAEIPADIHLIYRPINMTLNSAHSVASRDREIENAFRVSLGMQPLSENEQVERDAVYQDSLEKYIEANRANFPLKNVAVPDASLDENQRRKRENDRITNFREKITEEMDALLTEPLADPCTLCFYIATGDHFIPLMCRREGKNVEVLAYNSMSEKSHYNNYINIAKQAMEAVIRAKNFTPQILPTQHIPQGDTKSCGPNVGLVLSLVDEHKKLDEQIDFINEKIRHAMTDADTKQALRQQQYRVAQGMDAIAHPRNVQGIDDSIVNYLIDYSKPTHTKKLADLQKRQNQNKDSALSLEKIEEAAKVVYKARMDQLNVMRASPEARALRPESVRVDDPHSKKDNSKKNANPLKNDKQKEVLSPPKKAAPPKKFALPSGVELQEKSAAKWLWSLGQKGNEAAKNQFVASCNEVLGSLDFSITNIAFAENNGEHKMTFETAKASHDIYMTEKGLATEALDPAVYAVMAMAARKSLPDGTETAIVKVRPSNADEAQSEEICFQTGLALLNAGLVPQFPLNNSSQFINQFVNGLEPKQQETLNDSIAKLEAKGGLTPEVAALKLALPKPSVSFEICKEQPEEEQKLKGPGASG